MGLYFSHLFSLITAAKRDYKLLMVGLDAAGKTTILYNLRLGEITRTVPTIGFNLETVKYKNLKLTFWDIGGQDKIRALWKHYYNGNDGVIFVVDSNDEQRLELAAEELMNLLRNEEFLHTPVLVYANKQDLPNALSVTSISKGLCLDRLRRQPWYIQPCSALQSQGLYEGLEWMAKAMQQK